MLNLSLNNYSYPLAVKGDIAKVSLIFANQNKKRIDRKGPKKIDLGRIEGPFPKLSISDLQVSQIGVVSSRTSFPGAK